MAKHGLPCDCPACGAEDSVERVRSGLDHPDTALCTECRAAFTIEEDWSWDTERWNDYSTLGDKLTP